MRAVSYLACVPLVALAFGFSFLALIFTGGDSAFATESGWIYTPWLVALACTFAAIIATLAGAPRLALGLSAAAAVAYTATWFIWPITPDA